MVDHKDNNVLFGAIKESQTFGDDLTKKNTDRPDEAVSQTTSSSL